MRKEIVWAIAGGLFFGLIIAFGVFRINSKLKTDTIKSSPTPQANVPTSFKIVLNKPENEDVVTQDKVLVSGITQPLSWITLSGENSDYIIQADEKGVFQNEVELIPGVNQIKITAFDKNGVKSDEKVVVVFSSAFKETDDRAKVKAYLGVVTDITDSTIQIKSLQDEIKQISIKDGEVSGVKLKDIAIGDFIVAMGYLSPSGGKNSNQVLTAQRILIIKPVVEPKIDVLFGKYSDLTDKIIKSKKIVSKTKLTDILDEDSVIIINTVVSNKPATRTVFVIEKS